MLLHLSRRGKALAILRAEADSGERRYAASGKALSLVFPEHAPILIHEI